MYAFHMNSSMFPTHCYNMLRGGTPFPGILQETLIHIYSANWPLACMLTHVRTSLEILYLVDIFCDAHIVDALTSLHLGTNPFIICILRHLHKCRSVHRNTTMLIKYV
jgi:hypothetical protein